MVDTRTGRFLRSITDHEQHCGCGLYYLVAYARRTLWQLDRNPGWFTALARLPFLARQYGDPDT
ncbi:hypothetical protein KTAU_04680 [Thermogemmatispora aurantia]|uniref:Uncharacterized protein n=1 Tax=Thermogemmatispora aurantia TaxID=2045279 RepID=A0A5J4K528_9CHLR|nr:hypothetical protein KTAU_04680 [Thermogemmatispora aurantia]